MTKYFVTEQHNSVKTFALCYWYVGVYPATWTRKTRLFCTVQPNTCVIWASRIYHALSSQKQSYVSWFNRRRMGGRGVTNSCSSSDIIKMVESRKMGWAGHVARMPEMRKMLWTSEVKRPFGKAGVEFIFSSYRVPFYMKQKSRYIDFS